MFLDMMYACNIVTTNNCYEYIILAIYGNIQIVMQCWYIHICDFFKIEYGAVIIEGYSERFDEQTWLFSVCNYS